MLSLALAAAEQIFTLYRRLSEQVTAPGLQLMRAVALDPHHFPVARRDAHQRLAKPLPKPGSKVETHV